MIIDAAHLTAIPTLDPRTWRPHAPAPPRAGEPVAVALDILDEDHSLKLAMHRLAADRELRANLGQAGREYWQGAHTVEHMAAGYERVIERAASLSPDLTGAPRHLHPDPLEWATSLSLSVDPALEGALAALSPASRPDSHARSSVKSLDRREA